MTTTMMMKIGRVGGGIIMEDKAMVSEQAGDYSLYIAG